jgi:hypothetical protein
VLHVAQLADGERLATSVIAEEENIPCPSSPESFRSFPVKGIVDAMQEQRRRSSGPPARRNQSLGGGEAIDGEISLNRCVLNEDACPSTGTCPIREVWCGCRRIWTQLRGTNFATLLQRQADLENAVTYQPA